MRDGEMMGIGATFEQSIIDKLRLGASHVL